jgi:tetratricopeptide (TPR) repeat protein
MKKILILLFFIITIINLYPSVKNSDIINNAGITYTGDSDIFNNAVSLYTKNEFQKALQLFLDLKKKGYDNYEINYNTGSCYYKMGNLGYSRFYFERALIFKPFNKNVNINLKLIYSKISKDPVISEQEILNKKIIYFIPVILLIVLILSFFAGSIIFIILFFKSGFRKISMLFFIISAVFTLIFTIIFFIQFADFNKKIFVVSTNSANIYLLPKDNETIISTILEGTKGDIIKNNGNFFEIKLPEGSSGWIKKEDIISN